MRLRSLAVLPLLALSLSACGTSDTAYEAATAARAETVQDALTAQDAHNATYRTPCETDDSIGCVWDASANGDGQGQSYWADLDGNVFPITHAEARGFLDGSLPIPGQ